MGDSRSASGHRESLVNPSVRGEAEAPQITEVGSTGERGLFPLIDSV